MRTANTRILYKTLEILDRCREGVTCSDVRMYTGGEYHSVKDGLLFLMKIGMVEKIFTRSGYTTRYRLKQKLDIEGGQYG